MKVCCIARKSLVNMRDQNMGLTKGRVWRDAPAKDDRGHVAVMPIAILRLFLESIKSYLMRSNFRKIICGKN